MKKTTEKEMSQIRTVGDSTVIMSCILLKCIIWFTNLSWDW